MDSFDYPVVFICPKCEHTEPFMSIPWELIDENGEMRFIHYPYMPGGDNCVI
jgi:hypothetical protein